MFTRAATLPVVLSLIVLLTTSCASPPGGGEAKFSAPSSSGAAPLTVDASALAGDRLEAYLAQGGSQRVGKEVMAALAGSGRAADGTTLKVEITTFRLRSSSSAFWLGAMAGADTIACIATVQKPGEAPRTFNTDTSTAMGGFIRPGSTNRFNRLVKELARRIVAGI